MHSIFANRKWAFGNYKLRYLILSVVFSATSMSLLAPTAFAATGDAELISQSTNGQSGNGYTTNLAMSDNGRYVAFDSAAKNLASNETNTSVGPGNGSCLAVYVRDRQLGTTTLASVNSLGVEQNGCGQLNSISGNGEYVFFDEYNASNMGVSSSYVGQGTYTFRYQIATGDTQLVSLDGNGSPVAQKVMSVSYDGNLVVTGGNVWDVSGGGHTLVASETGGKIWSISGSGSKLLYTKQSNSNSTMLFVRDRTTDTEQRVDLGDNDTPVTDFNLGDNGHLSRDGNSVFFLAYDSAVTADTHQYCQYQGCMYKRDLTTQQTTLIKATIDGVTLYPNDWTEISVTADGNAMVVNGGRNFDNVWPDDYFTNNTGLVYLNLQNNSTHYVNLLADGTLPSDAYEYPTAITASGDEVALVNDSDNLGTQPNCRFGGGDPVQCWDVYVTVTQ